MELKGKAALVTGGSRGLGAALGRELARRGARVALVARHGEELREVVHGIRREGGEAHALTGDVGLPEDAWRLAGAAAATVGPLDVVVHNASTLGPLPLRPLLDTPAAEMERVLQVNLLGPLRLSQAVAGAMVLRASGLVVLVTSDAAANAYPRWGAYGVSKAALEQMGRIWAAELAESGVRFLIVDPGEMDTRMHAEAVPEADPASLADPREVAAALASIMENEADHPTGSRVEVATAAPAVRS